MQFHPAANLFPMMEGERFEALKNDMATHGQNEPIIMLGGMILDGRNRYRAVTELGMIPRLREYDGEQDPVDYVVSQNLFRRHLTSSQCALLATEAVGLKARLQAEAKEKQREGGAKGGSNTAKDKVRELIPEAVIPSPRPRDVLAEQFNTNPRYIQDAEKIAEERPDLAEKVRAGEISIPQAMTEIKPHVAHNSGENNWFTPGPIIEAARAVMGGIDVDPASHSKANEAVRAASYFTAETDGLKQAWLGRVWLNPPYAQPLIDKFLTSLVAKLESGETTEACVLVNNASETGWMQKMLSLNPAICFHRGRVKFLGLDGLHGAPLQGQWTLYFGKNKKAFEREFGKFGPIAPSVVT
jgi:ParB family chromosome partitioning protein